jgi:hypothetical protein
MNDFEAHMQSALAVWCEAMADICKEEQQIARDVRCGAITPEEAEKFVDTLGRRETLARQYEMRAQLLNDEPDATNHIATFDDHLMRLAAAGVETDRAIAEARGVRR